MLRHSATAMVLLLCLSWQCGAQVQLDAQPGFDPQTPLLRVNAWTPIQATLRNTGPDVEGTLRIRAKRGDAGSRLAQDYPLALPRNSTKQVRDAVFLPPGCDGVEVEFVVKRKVIASVASAFQVADPSLLSILVVGGEDWVRSIKNQVKDDPRTLRSVLYAGRSESLPDHPAAYDGIDTILLDRVEWTRVLPSQVDALRGFVGRGGNLIFSSGRAAEGLGHSPLAALVPVTIGTTETSQQPVRLLSEVVPVHGDRHLLVTQAETRPEVSARVISSDTKGRPIIVESRLGLGRVTFLAFQLGDPSLRDWTGRVYLWRFLFARELPPLLDARGDSFTQSLRDAAQNNTLLAIPTSNQVGILLLAYVVGLIPLNHLFWRWMKRPLWAWAALPVFSIGIGVGMIVNERIVARDNLSLTEVTLLRARSGQATARADAFLCLQSPYGARFDVSAPDSGLAWLPLASKRDRHFVLSAGTKTSELGFDVQRKDVAAFRAVYETGLGKGIDVRVGRDGQAIRGQVFNHTGMTFLRSGLIGPTGTETEFVLVADSPATPTRPAPPWLDDRVKSLDDMVRQSVLPLIDLRPRTVFWAVAEGAPLRVALQEPGGRPARITRESRWSLLLCDAPFTLGEGPFEIGPDHWRVRVVRASVYNERDYLGLDAQKLSKTFYFRELVFEAQPDVTMPIEERLEIDGLQWELNCNSDATDLKRELFNFVTNSWDVPVNNLGRAQASRYLHPRTGAILLRLTGSGQKELGAISVRVTGARAQPEGGA